MDLATLRPVARLAVAGLLVGAALTAVATIVGGRSADPLTWLSSVATVGALVVAIGIYAVQRRDQDLARQELLDRLDAQDELLSGLASAEPADPGDDDLTDAQRAEVERVYGPDSVAATWDTGGDGDRMGPRLVRLRDGQVATVFTAGRGGRTIVRPVRAHGVPRGDRSAGRDAARRERSDRGR